MLVLVFLLWQMVCRYTRKETERRVRSRTVRRDGLSANEELGDVFGEPTASISEPGLFGPCPESEIPGVPGNFQLILRDPDETELLSLRAPQTISTNWRVETRGLNREGFGGVLVEPTASRLVPELSNACPAGTDVGTELQLWQGGGSEIVRRRSCSLIGSEISNAFGNQQLMEHDPHGIVGFGDSESQASSVVDAVLAPPTYVRRMRCKVSSIIKSKASHVYITSAIQKMIDYLELHEGPVLMVITGRQGDGKTSAGLKVLSELEDRGIDVFHVTEPRELSKICLKAQKAKIAILVENICGKLVYDENKWRDWQRVVTGVVEHENGLMLLVTGNNFVIQPWLNRLESIPDVLEIRDLTKSCEMSFEDKLGILRALEKKLRLNISEELRQSICELEVRFGFPKRCRNYLQDVNRTRPTSRDISNFTSYSNNEVLMAKILMKAPDLRNLFQRMLACEGRLDVTQITDNNERYHISTLAKDFEGIFLQTKGNVYMFMSDSIYCLFAFAYWDTDKLFILDNSPMQFLNSKLRLSGTGDYLFISEDDMTSLLARCLKEIRRGNLLLVLSLHIVRSPVFAEMLMTRLLDEMDCLERVLCLKDRTHKTSFAFLLSSSKGSQILKLVLDHPDFSKVIAKRFFSMLTEIVFGICYSAASDCLNLLKSEFFVDLNIRNEHGQTPLMIAANNKHEEFLMSLMFMNANFNAFDDQDKTILHYICENGLLKALEVLLEVWVDVNIGLEYGITPLLCACEFNHIGAVSRLLQKGAIIDTVSIHEAAKTGNIQLMELLIDNGGDIHGLLENGNTVLHTACGSTFNLKMIQLLIEKGLDVNARGFKDRTPLIVAKDAKSSVIVNYLKSIGGSDGVDSPDAEINDEHVGDEQERGASWSF